MPPIVLDGTTGITTPGLTNTGTETLVNLTTTGNTTLGDASTDTLNVGNGGLIKDASGNVGIGVTPSAWTAGRTALQIYGSSTAVYFAGATTNTVFANNYYYNAGDKFVTASGYAQNYQQQSGGSHVWLTSSATSGGAGATATMNTLMTLDASGNLLVGTTTATSKVTVGGTSDVRVTINETSGSVRTDLYSQTGTGGVGTQSNHPFQLFTNGSERARIDTSGNLFVGATAAISGNSERLGVTASGASQPAILAKSVSGANDYTIPVWNATTTGDAKFIGFFTEASATLRGSITYNRGGGLTAYNVTSDYRAKTVNGPVVNALEKLASLKPTTGRMNGAEFDIDFFVAHELQEVVPSAVTGEKDAVNEDGTPNYQMVDKSALIPLLTAAIQEQQSIINTLTDRISALEQK